jgi:hypothetical protein
VTHKGECFCGAVLWRSRGTPKAWGMVIADHAVRGQVDQSTLLRFGNLTPCGSRPVPTCWHVPEDGSLAMSEFGIYSSPLGLA